MSMNTSPNYPSTPNISWATLATANTAKDGTGTVATIFTAGSNGAWLKKIKLRAVGTNVASVARFFINNGLATSTAANNTLFYEYSLPATTLTEIAAQNDIDLDMDFCLPAGYTITVAIGTTVAAGWQITGIGRNF